MIRHQIIEEPQSGTKYLLPLDLANLEALRVWKKKRRRAIAGKEDTEVEVRTEVNGSASEREEQVMADNTQNGSSCGRNAPIDSKFGEKSPTSLLRTSQVPSKPPNHSPPSSTPPSYLLLRESLFNFIPKKTVSQNIKGTEETGHILPRKLVPYRIADVNKEAHKSIYWRQDMLELVTMLLEKRAFTSIENVLKFATDRTDRKLALPLDVHQVNPLDGASTGLILWIGKGELSTEDIDGLISSIYKDCQEVPDMSGFSFGRPMTQTPVLPLKNGAAIPIIDINCLFKSMASSPPEYPNKVYPEDVRMLLGSTKEQNQDWWLLRCSHGSVHKAITEIWRLYQFHAYDGDVKKLVDKSENWSKWRTRRPREPSDPPSEVSDVRQSAGVVNTRAAPEAKRPQRYY
ncbi:hypothetical protein UCRPC4_g02030 [Phaeomoniella chlamydospora]|uniref:Uncharacterized protein n=1 Tax=Phaeomoniella chlamydospora TaxID=158046 RepID=A0A0G2H960_PHACM|nr:hypothetical protein UCRPC4_g02030 [Phaeomoniella chlamydospora]